MAFKVKNRKWKRKQDRQIKYRPEKNADSNIAANMSAVCEFDMTLGDWEYNLFLILS